MRNLTIREIEVLHLISQELTMKEIACKLHLSIHTVISHKRNLLIKMDARNMAGLVRRGFEFQLLNVPLKYSNAYV